MGVTITRHPPLVPCQQLFYIALVNALAITTDLGKSDNKFKGTTTIQLKSEDGVLQPRTYPYSGLSKY